MASIQIKCFNDNVIKLRDEASIFLNYTFEEMCKRMKTLETDETSFTCVGSLNMPCTNGIPRSHYYSYERLNQVRSTLPKHIEGDLNVSELCKQAFSPDDVTINNIPPFSVVCIEKHQLKIENYDTHAIKDIVNDMTLNDSLYSEFVFVKAITDRFIHLVLFSKDEGYGRLVPSILNNSLISNVEVKPLVNSPPIEQFRSNFQQFIDNYLPIEQRQSIILNQIQEQLNEICTSQRALIENTEKIEKESGDTKEQMKELKKRT